MCKFTSKLYALAINVNLNHFIIHFFINSKFNAMKKLLLFLALCASFGMIMAQDAEVIKGILPYGLTSSVDEEGANYTFKFSSNSNAESAYLTFYDATTGEEVGTYPLEGVVEGANEFVVAAADLPGANGQEMNWAVTLVGKPITDYTLINNPDDFSYSGIAFCTVDNSPESDFFGRIYVGNRAGNANPQNGMWIYNPDYTRVNSEAIKARSDGLSFRSNYRMSIDCEGKVYVPDWGDPTSGVFVFDPANPDAGFKEFFSNPDGTSLNRDGDGLLTNANGVEVAGSSPGVGIVGSGANTKLYVYNEDIFVNGSGNNVSVYNIGNEDGTIATCWNKAPDATYAIGELQLNTNGNVVGDEEHGGVWVAQYRSAGNNAAGIPSLIYVNAAGEIVFNSGYAPTNEILNGSDRSGFAISADNKTLVINDGSYKANVFNITWTDGVPSLEYVTKFDSGLGSVYQMHFDYAGNLIMSGSKVAIFACPTEENVTTVPAKKALIVQHPGSAVTEIEQLYLVGTFNGWSQEDGMIAFIENEGSGEFTANVELESNAEFKVIAPNGDGGWQWFGGQDENHVGYFLIKDDLLGAYITLIDGANFRVEDGGKYVVKVMNAPEMEGVAPRAVHEPLVMVVTKNTTDITTISSEAKGDNAWYNMSGIRFENRPTAPGIYIHNGRKVIIK